MPIRLHGPAPDVRLNANGLAMLLPVNGRVAALRLDARTLKHGDPQTDPNVPPPNRGDLPHLLTANAGDGWLVVATTFHSPFYRTDLYRIGKDGSVARVLPPGTDPKPATSGHGTVYPAGEGFDFSNADYLIPGFRNGPLLLGLHRNTDRTRRTPGDLEVAIIGPDGHPKGAPVPQDPSLPTSPI